VTFVLVMARMLIVLAMTGVLVAFGAGVSSRMRGGFMTTVGGVVHY
jgi:hypothetical protein